VQKQGICGTAGFIKPVLINLIITMKMRSEHRPTSENGK
jgi:hypothetical protein